MKEIINDLVLFLKKNFIGLIVIISIFIASMIITVCWYNIPRLHFEYDEYLNGYVVEHAFGNSKEYTIPKSYKDKEVVGIGERAFYNHDKLENLIFIDHDNIEIIKKLAFSGCHNLKTMDLKGIETIERNAFMYCYSLNDLKVDARQIGASAFYECTSLDTITLNEGCKSIGTMAFSKTAISDIILPVSVTHVYNDAFIEMDNLKSIVIKNIELLNNEYLNSLGSIVRYEE